MILALVVHLLTYIGTLIFFLLTYQRIDLFLPTSIKGGCLGVYSSLSLSIGVWRGWGPTSLHSSHTEQQADPFLLSSSVTSNWGATSTAKSPKRWTVN